MKRRSGFEKTLSITVSSRDEVGSFRSGQINLTTLSLKPRAHLLHPLDRRRLARGGRRRARRPRRDEAFDALVLLAQTIWPMVPEC